MAQKVSIRHTQTIAAAAALSDAFCMLGYSEMIIVMPSAWTAASIGFQVCDTLGGTYAPLSDAAGNLLEATVAVDNAYRVTTVQGPYVKLWSETAGSGVNQVAEREIDVILIS